jgi:hypothetical protein
MMLAWSLRDSYKPIVQSLQNSFRVKAEVMRFKVHCKQRVTHMNKKPVHVP